jgi:hypothetical protein
MIIEMRTYKTMPGRRSQFLGIFRSKSIPAHAEIGMKILGPLLSVEDPDTFFFMRRFPDLPSREPMKAKFSQGELWKGALENVLRPMLESTKSSLWKTLTTSFIGSGSVGIQKKPLHAGLQSKMRHPEPEGMISASATLPEPILSQCAVIQADSQLHNHLVRP